MTTDPTLALIAPWRVSVVLVPTACAVLVGVLISGSNRLPHHRLLQSGAILVLAGMAAQFVSWKTHPYLASEVLEWKTRVTLARAVFHPATTDNRPIDCAALSRLLAHTRSAMWSCPPPRTARPKDASG